MLFSIIEAAALAAALSLDSFVAGFAYGSNNVKISFLSVQIINIICTGVVGLSILAGTLVRDCIPTGLTTGLSFFILLMIGLFKLIDGWMKAFIRRHTNFERQVEFSVFNLRFILSLYADPEQSDADDSKSISATEAVSIALALSLDGLAVGFGAAIGNANGFLVVLWSLLTNTIFLLSGCLIGRKIARQVRFDISWIGGIVLILMAFVRIIPF